MLVRVLEFVHLVFALSYVASLVVAEWNGRAARATQDWGQRAMLYQIIWLSGRVAGLGGLLMSGIFGNLAAIRLDYSMTGDRWFQIVNGVWLLAVVCMVLITVPNAGKLAKASRAAAGGENPEGFERAQARWRFGNVLQSLLYIIMLALMVAHWKV